jgi:hypothetical protein
MGKKRSPSWTDMIFGTNKQGKRVTAQFGKSSKYKGHTLLSDGHKSRRDFVGKKGARLHDHYNGKGGGAKPRGKYTGYGS